MNVVGSEARVERYGCDNSVPPPPFAPATDAALTRRASVGPASKPHSVADHFLYPAPTNAPADHERVLQGEHTTTMRRRGAAATLTKHTGPAPPASQRGVRYHPGSLDDYGMDDNLVRAVHADPDGGAGVPTKKAKPGKPAPPSSGAAGGMAVRSRLRCVAVLGMTWRFSPAS